MVTKIEDKTTMTVREMESKYADKWFRYVITSDLNFLDPKSNICFVIYTADSEKELLRETSVDEFGEVSSGITFGREVIHQEEVGGIVYG